MFFFKEINEKNVNVEVLHRCFVMFDNMLI